MFQNPHQNPRQNRHHDSRRETQNVIVIDLLQDDEEKSILLQN